MRDIILGLLAMVGVACLFVAFVFLAAFGVCGVG